MQQQILGRSPVKRRYWFLGPWLKEATKYYSHTGPVLSPSRSVRAVRLVPGSCARMRRHPSVGGKDEINKEELTRVAHNGSRGRVGRTETQVSPPKSPS